MHGGMYIAVFFFLATAAVALFTFIGVAVWTDARKQERLALYRAELLKKLAEHPGEGAQQVLEVLREETLRKDLAKRRGLLLGGMITGAVGIGLMALLSGIKDTQVDLRAVGFIPFLIGLALFLFGLLGLRPRQPAREQPPPPHEPA